MLGAVEGVLEELGGEDVEGEGFGFAEDERDEGGGADDVDAGGEDFEGEDWVVVLTLWEEVSLDVICEI